jgi:hypothetical protein
MKKNVLIVGAVIALGALSVCSAFDEADYATTKSSVDQALNEARAAKTAADSAKAAAEEAKRIANNAQNTANRAAQAASEAQSCCKANTDRLERMFQKSMSK